MDMVVVSSDTPIVIQMVFSISRERLVVIVEIHVVHSGVVGSDSSSSVESKLGRVVIGSWRGVIAVTVDRCGVTTVIDVMVETVDIAVSCSSCCSFPI